jgi:hypothetical protein
MRWQITSWLKAGHRVPWRATQRRAASCAFFVLSAQHDVRSMLEALGLSVWLLLVPAREQVGHPRQPTARSR